MNKQQTTGGSSPTERQNGMNKAQKLIGANKLNPETSPALCKLIEFACQNSGIEPRDYFDPADLREGRRQTYRDGVQAFRQEQRSISADLKRFKDALTVAVIEGVTDREIIAEAPHDFSGRLSWVSHKAHVTRMTNPAKYGGTHKGGKVVSEVDVWDWEYTSGQYFPTEYRKAAATLLEYATKLVRRSRPAQKKVVQSMAELKELNVANGGCWFSKETMRFFRCRIESQIFSGKYFVTSEQCRDESPRLYTIRSFDEKGDVDTVGEFQGYSSKREAVLAIRDLVKAEENKEGRIAVAFGIKHETHNA